MGYEELKIEGRNAVLEAFRSGKTIDKLFVLDGCQDGPVRTIVREAKKHDTIVHFVEKERLDQLSETKKHQGVIAVAAAYEYAEVEDMLKLAAQTVHPAEDTGLQGHPLWNEAKMLRPEADALFIRDYGGNQLRLVIP